MSERFDPARKPGIMMLKTVKTPARIMTGMRVSIQLLDRISPTNLSGTYR